MGRPVWKQAALKVTAALTTSPVLDFYADSAVLWRSTMVTIYPYQWAPSSSPATTAATWTLRVNATDVAELSLARSFVDPSSFVIPWHDGIRFANHDRVGWRLTTTGSIQIWAAASIHGGVD